MYVFLYDHMLSVFLDKNLGVLWLVHTAGTCLPFNKLPNCFTEWLYYFIFPLAVYDSSSCSTSLSTLGMISILNFNPANKCVVVVYCGFNLHLLRTNHVKHRLICIFATHICSLVKLT